MALPWSDKETEREKDKEWVVFSCWVRRCCTLIFFTCPPPLDDFSLASLNSVILFLPIMALSLLRKPACKHILSGLQQAYSYFILIVSLSSGTFIQPAAGLCVAAMVTDSCVNAMATSSSFIVSGCIIITRHSWLCLGARSLRVSIFYSLNCLGS